ncbi:hypothetical protein K525DRAFT_286686 [Schizophyllum commune Loenen D]|nr:hypothetical protein K525DRAFT_286686 [Schizophyllum commune Loenen D]
MSIGSYKAFSDELRRVFLQGKPKLPVSSVRAPSWQRFVRSWGVPQHYARPALVLDGMRPEGRAEMQTDRIFCKGRHTLLQNVSGSGKTSLVMEGLRRLWGLYFVGIPDQQGIGSNDVCRLANIARKHLFHDDDARLEMLKIPLLVRLLAFELFAETIDVTRATQGDRELWLLAQACVPYSFWKSDAYTLLSLDAYWNRIDVSKEIDSAITRIRALTKDADFHLYCVIDEAQALAPSDLPIYPGDASTSIHREITRSWQQYPWLTLVVSGDTFPYDQYRRIETDTPHRLHPQWFGKLMYNRHRFSAAFVGFFLVYGLTAPHTILNHYIARMTGFRPVDSTALVRREKRIIDHSQFVITPLRTVNEETSFFSRGTLHHILEVFGRDRIALVESGAGRFRDDNASQIVVDEPLSLISAAQWFCESKDAAGRGSFFPRHLIYHDHPQISSAREHTAFLLVSALNVRRKLGELFHNLETPTALATEPAELVEFHRTSDTTVKYRPFRYSDLSTSHPSVIATNCTTYQDVLAWLRHERTSPICLMPDQTSLLFALRLSNGSFLWIIARTSLTASNFRDQFCPPNHIRLASTTDISEAMSLLSGIPAPCTLLRSPPIIAVAMFSPERPPPEDRTTWNRTLFDQVEAAVSQRDILLRLVANIVQLDAPPALELLDPLDKNSGQQGATSESIPKSRVK